MSSSTRITRERTYEGPASSTKTTTYETKSSYEVDAPVATYRPLITPRTTIIHRAAYGPNQRVGSSVSERSVSYSSGLPGGSFLSHSSTGVHSVKNSRDREKKDMQDLNERFAGYIEKVRFLEAQNRKLADELEKLKQKWGIETTAIKAMYQTELDEARRLLEECDKEKGKLEVRAASLEDQCDDLRRKVEEAQLKVALDREKLQHQDQQLSDMEAEVNLLRRRVQSMENDREKNKREIVRLHEALNRARIDLDNETLNHIDAENRRQTLEEELEFLKGVHEQEMKELAALAYRDTTAENREFWKTEMGSALRDIQITYDGKLDAMRGEMDTYYNMKMQEFRTGATRQALETAHAKEESKRLRTVLSDLRNKVSDLEGRNALIETELAALRREFEEKEREWDMENNELKSEVAKLRAEMEAILKELQDLMDTKLGLELEIAAYRKLLEGEENRVGLKQVIDTWAKGGRVQSEDSSLRVSQVIKGETSAKTTYQRSAKGPVTISECSADGKFVCLENTGRKEEQLGGWKIKREIDGNAVVDFTIDMALVLKPVSKIKLWVAGSKPADAKDDLEIRLNTWGTGGNVTTKLVNSTGEDRATHVQKTSFTS